MEHEHNWQFQGVVYSEGDMLAGSGARHMIYEDRYYCTKCLEVTYKNRVYKGNNYSKPIPNSFPKE